MTGLRQVRELVDLAPAVRKRLILAISLAVLGGVAAVVGFVCVAYAIDALLRDVAFGGWLGSAFGALVVSFGAKWLAEGVAHEASFDLEVALRRELAESLANMPLGEVQRLGSGRIKKVMQDDVRALHNVVADAVPFFGSAFAQPVAALLALGLVQWKVLLAVLLIVPIAMVCFKFMTKDYTEQRDRYNAANEDINSAVVEFVQGMPVVRTFDDGRVSFRRFSDSVKAFTSAVGAWMATGRASGVLTRLFIVPLPTLLIVVATGVPMVAAGWISTPDLVLGLLIGAMPIEAISPLMHLVNYVNDSKAGAARIVEVLAIPPLAEPAEPQVPQGSAVELDRVRFRYSTDRADPALDDVSIAVPAGSVCALVGPSGSGKSTVARLVPRFYDVEAGSVRVGGVDVRDIPSDVLLRHVSLVFQDPYLVEGTVAENIRLAKPDATDAEVEEAAKAAAAHDFIVTELSDGYASQVGERGGRLSGGQRQRVTIARAILSGAPIVILDEATAFTDPENEAAIQDAITELTRGRTVLIIAHRLNTIVNADQIVVLDHGRVVERGRHADLVAAGGRYADLWHRHEQAASWGVAR